VLCEDRHNNAYLRQADINRYFGCTMRDLAGRLLTLPRRSKHNALAIFDHDGNFELTPFFFQLLADLKAFGAKFVVLDGRSDVFPGNQNDEHQARDFVRHVTDRIAEETGGIVIMLYQPSRGGRPTSMGGDGSGESGSVQWDAAFRCRLVLNPANPDKDEPEIRHLVRKKSNFSPKGEEITLRWQRGVFIRDDEWDAARPSGEINLDKHKAQRLFLEFLDLRNNQGRPVSASRNSSEYAVKAAMKHWAGTDEGKGVKFAELEYAMEALLKKAEITNQEYGPPSRPQKRLVRTDFKSYA